MSRHTPGPWTVAQLGKGDPYHVKGGKYELNVCNTNTGAFGCDESIENARLIAAAPELLDMLLALECDINTMVYCYDKRPENFWRAMAVAKENAVLARAAIAKARGDA